VNWVDNALASRPETVAENVNYHLQNIKYLKISNYTNKNL